ncbi:MAG: hypothetical protein JSV04_14605 [Candidatus Heimdallarchaeota archaeon]|nr:MAG: hypothetical protein JSV04_14605 [Candidatus Heimdallarchaeota archaeon]
MGSIQLFSEMLDIKTDEKILAQEIKRIVGEKSSDEPFSEIIYKKVQEQPWLPLGGVLMASGFGAWEVVLLGLSLRIISISLISIGLVLTFVGAFQLLFDFLFGKITKAELEEANDIISYGVIWSSSERELIVTQPPKFPFIDEIQNSLVKDSVSACGEESNLHFYAFSVADEPCVVAAFCFLSENNTANSMDNNFILSFVIRPPWSDREKLLKHSWGDRKKFSKLFDRMSRVRDSIKDSLDEETIQKEMESLRGILTKSLILTLYKESKQSNNSSPNS